MCVCILCTLSQNRWAPAFSSKIHHLRRCLIPPDGFAGFCDPKPQCTCVQGWPFHTLYCGRDIIYILQIHPLHPLPTCQWLTDRVPCWEWGLLPGFTVIGLSASSAGPGLCYLPLRPAENKLSSLCNSHFCSEKAVGVIHLLLSWSTASPSSPRRWGGSVAISSGRVLSVSSLHCGRRSLALSPGGTSAQGFVNLKRQGQPALVHELRGNRRQTWAMVTWLKMAENEAPSQVNWGPFLWSNSATSNM